MIELAVVLIPVALGVIASPLAIIALVAVLLSRSARRNGVMYLLGWALALTVAVVAASLLVGLFDPGAEREAPAWVPAVRLVLGTVLAVGAVWTYRRSSVRLAQMAGATTPEGVASAAPQLPGWLHAVDTFSPGRCLGLGLGIFLLNPVNVSCAFLAALDVHLAGLDAPAPTAFLTVFVVLGILPIAVPVALVLKQGEGAAPALSRIRAWIAAHNGTLSAALLAIVAIMQIQKGLVGLPWQ